MDVRRLPVAGAACVAVLFAMAPAQAQTPPADPTGVWIDHTGRGAVEITPCGDNLCGKVVWLKDTADKQGCGIQILGDVKPAGPGVWDKGWIYDPDQDSKFSVELKPLAGEKLRVLGYMGTKLFSETMTWQRAPADLQRCDAPGQSAAATPSTGSTPSQPSTGSQPPVAATGPAAPAPKNESVASAPEAAPAPAPAAPDASADQKPRRQARAQTKDCKVEMPWFSVTFPCPD